MTVDEQQHGTRTGDDATGRATGAGGSHVPDAGMFDLARLEPPPKDWALAVAPAAAAWLGSVAFLGQFRPNEIADALASVAPLDVLHGLCVAACVVGGAAAIVARRRPLAVLWAAVFGYLLGHPLFAVLPVHESIDFGIPFASGADGWAFVQHRLVYGACVTVCAGGALLLAARALGSRPRLHLGLGSWRAIGRDFTHASEPASYRSAIGGFALFAAVLWVVGQMGVELEPLRSGVLWGLLPAILLAALTNALVEEVVYRGLLQPAFVHAAGIARGLWIQGMMFGMLHWGLSVGVVAALPTSLMIGVGSVFWGKAVLETRGLSWVVVAHAMVDVAIMSAYFVPRG